MIVGALDFCYFFSRKNYIPRGNACQSYCVKDFNKNRVANEEKNKIPNVREFGGFQKVLRFNVRAITFCVTKNRQTTLFPEKLAKNA